MWRAWNYRRAYRLFFWTNFKGGQNRPLFLYCYLFYSLIFLPSESILSCSRLWWIQSLFWEQWAQGRKTFHLTAPELSVQFCMFSTCSCGFPQCSLVSSTIQKHASGHYSYYKLPLDWLPIRAEFSHLVPQCSQDRLRIQHDPDWNKAVP